MKGGVSKTRGQSDVGLVVQSSQLDVTELEQDSGPWPQWTDPSTLKHDFFFNSRKNRKLVDYLRVVSFHPLTEGSPLTTSLGKTPKLPGVSHIPASPPISQNTLGKPLASVPRFSHLQN